MNFQIAVRSYKRPQMWIKKTYRLLQENDLLNRTTLFLATEEQKTEYLAYLSDPPTLHVIGQPGGATAWRAICNYYPEGTPVLLLDDDLDTFFIWRDKTTLIRKSRSLKSFLEYAFQTLQERACGSFTFNLSTSKLYVKYSPWAIFAPKFVVGCAFGLIITPLIRDIMSRLPDTHGHDSFLTAELLTAYRGTLKFEFAGFTTKICKNPGGLEDVRQDTESVCRRHFTQSDLLRSFFSFVVYRESQHCWSYKLKNIRNLRQLLQTQEYELPWPNKIEIRE